MLLSRNSPFGAFVRRSQLEYTRLQFHDATKLWKNLIIYRAPTLAFWKRRNPSASRFSFDFNLNEASFGGNGQFAGIVYAGLSGGSFKDVNDSTQDMENLYEYQIARMERMGSRVPQALQAQLRAMAQPGATVPNASFYVQFLDSWKSGDYPSSFDNLHRYFDYTMQSRDRALYQYALLSLAILQADFGCFSEAIIAMRETIATARENHDMPCLNYSLSWLYQFGRAHQEEMTKIQEQGVLGSEKEALSFLKAKAKESNMWPLLSTTLLSEARLILSHGETISHASESVLKASHLSLTKGVTEGHGGQMLMHASIFDRLGVGCQAWVYGELFLHCYGRQSPSGDVIQSQCQRAYMLARKGEYEEALSCMEKVDLEALRTLRHQQYWTLHLGLLKLRRSLYRNDIDAGENVLAQLQATPVQISGLQFNVSKVEIELQIRRGNYSRALVLQEQLITKLSQQETDIVQRLEVMILKARIFDKAGIAQKGFSVAIRVASLAHKARLVPVLWEAIGAICRILVSAKQFDAAVQLLESVLPQALECEDGGLAAYLFSCLADGHMGLAGQAKDGSLQRKERLTKTLESLDRAFTEYSRIEDIKGQCEMLAKKATIMHLNGDPMLANDCAAKYLDTNRAAKE
ncbi:MAG: hypothetical protein Q9202_005669 [Teloschistes flavicans]